VGRGKGLKLVVAEGRVRSRPGRGHCSRYPTRALRGGRARGGAVRAR
jgi:hypothetical protein